MSQPPAHSPPTRSSQPKIPRPLTLRALQGYVREIVAARGFTTDLNQVFILLVEEVGELASELKLRRFYPERFETRALGLELADILLYLADLANGFGIDLMETWPAHEAANDLRFANRRGGEPPATVPPRPPLNALARHLEVKRAERGFQDDPEMLAVLLTEEVGEIATELRKHWKQMHDVANLAHELIDALTYTLRLANWFGIDLEQAVHEKEGENAKREWAY